MSKKIKVNFEKINKEEVESIQVEKTEDSIQAYNEDVIKETKTENKKKSQEIVEMKEGRLIINQQTLFKNLPDCNAVLFNLGAGTIKLKDSELICRENESIEIDLPYFILKSGNQPFYKIEFVKKV